MAKAAKGVFALAAIIGSLQPRPVAEPESAPAAGSVPHGWEGWPCRNTTGWHAGRTGGPARNGAAKRSGSPRSLAA